MNDFPSQFQPAYEKLLKSSVNSYIKTEEQFFSPLSKSELGILISVASISSLSDDPALLSLSYEICSRVIESHAGDNINLLCSVDMILSRIGNFPGRRLLREKFHNSGEPLIPIALAMERLTREIENSISEDVSLTDFQYKLYSSLGTERSLSVSAPTSAGKSFVLSLDLTRRLRESLGHCIVYIVPTRALVSEVTGRIRKILREEGLEGVIVRTAPFPVSDIAQGPGVVYVLTQERLMSLLAAPMPAGQISLLIVDEAHELQKGKRGILLQDAIDLALLRSPSAAVFFASPLIKNPGYLLNLFARHQDGRFFTEEVSPVSQNVILVSQIVGKPFHVELGLLRNDSVLRVGRAKLDFKFRNSIAAQQANFASQICKDEESVILFASTAADAEKTAKCLVALCSTYVASDELCDFIKFIEAEIHSEYPLAATLRRGVGFHYGNMPSIVRTGVEKFFKDGEIRFLCCTSTLLQGVNLPAKHIVIHDPHLGSEPMQRADFRNLAGRAGRLLKEFHGNVWCLRPTEWGIASFEGDDLQEIRSAMSYVMADGGTLIKSIIEGDQDPKDRDLADAAYSRLYYEISTEKSGAESIVANYSSDENIDVLQSNIAALAALEITIPSEILHAHRAVRPDLLQKLYLIIKMLPHIDEAMLLNPHEVGGKQRMAKAVSLIHEAFGIQMSEMQTKWICGLAHDWTWGKPIGQMIVDRVDFVRSRDRSDSTSQIIRDLLQVVEKEIRFNLVKFFGAFEALIKLVLIERGKKELADGIAPYHVYLEFGSSDRITLNLMALGLSRFTAIKLAKLPGWGDAIEPEQLLARIKGQRVNNLGLPKICQGEIKELLGVT